jgi:adenylate cyclase
MPLEIERKFLVRKELWTTPERGSRLIQGYFAVEGGIGRVRIDDDAAFLTLKGPVHGISREEDEFVIPRREAEQLLHAKCERPWIEKTRYEIAYGGHTWEVDVFEGENRGLIVAEVELDSPGEAVELPPWVGEEVSSDPRYFNSNLVLLPYRKWA